MKPLKDTNYKTLAEHVFSRLRREGRSLYAFSKSTGIDRSRLSRISLGKATFSLRELLTIARVFSLELIFREVKKIIEMRTTSPLSFGYA